MSCLGSVRGKIFGGRLQESRGSLTAHTDSQTSPNLSHSDNFMGVTYTVEAHHAASWCYDFVDRLPNLPKP
eukprot:29070-Eustigmatos_ZCMA.PRE.1